MKRNYSILVAMFIACLYFVGCDATSDDSDSKEETKVSSLVGKYQFVDLSTTVDVKVDGTISIETADGQKKFNGSYKETKDGADVSFTMDGKTIELTSTKIEDDVQKMVSEIGIDTYAVKISKTATSMAGTWSNGEMETTIDANGNFSIPVSQDYTITGKATITGNSFVMKDAEENEVATGVVSASGKAYMSYSKGEDLVQGVFTKK